MRGTLLVAGAIAALGGVARAETIPLAVELECKVGKQAIALDGPAAIDGHLGCAVTAVGGVVGEGSRATVTLIQEGRGEPPVRETGAFVREGLDAPEGEEAVGLPRARFQLDPFRRVDDFRPCNDFELLVTVATATETVTRSVPVTTKCKKPKKLAAKLTCEYYGLDGAGPVTYPGKNARPRLESTLTCWLRAGKGKAAERAVASFVAGEMPWVEPLYLDDETRQWSAGAILEPEEDFSACEPFTVKAWVTSALGQVIWSGKVAIPQSCP